MTGRLFSRQFFCSFLSSKSGSREESPIRSPQGHPSSHITAHRTVQLKGRNRQGERGRIPQFRQLRNASPLYSSRQRALAQKKNRATFYACREWWWWYLGRISICHKREGGGRNGGTSCTRRNEGKTEGELFLFPSARSWGKEREE